ncbi:MAG TPA: ATP-dependent Clp protease adapter ClpS [Verrucomicrobiota bacterium]|nr:ATP-dependent Clp protease adapter ClpS [Verrucomicrobiota bacterium]
MPVTQEPPGKTGVVIEEVTESRADLDAGYLVIVWNDPVNLMDYVTHVFMAVFRWPREKAAQHMLEVHRKGRSVVAQESFEKAEAYAHQLHGYSLQATLEKAA